MYVVQPQHNRVVNVVNVIWLGDDDEGESMRFTTTTPNGDSCAGVYTYERLAFVDHPPAPRLLEPEPALDPAFISAARWKKKHVH